MANLNPEPTNGDSTRASLDLLYNVSRELATTLDLHSVLARVLFLSIENVRAERGTLILFDAQRKPVDAAIVCGDQYIEHTAQQVQATLDQGLAGWVVRHRQAVLVADTSKDERWLRRPDDAEDRTGAKSALCLPLLARELLVGVLTIVHSRPYFFTPEHLALIQSIADQAGIAVHNALLYDSLQNATRRYRELFEDSIDPILITDLQGKILEANRQAQRSSGYSSAELAGVDIRSLQALPPERFNADLEAVVAGGPVAYESQLTSRQGQHIPIEAHVRRIEISGESNLQWTLHDISERKALDALQEDLIAMIYHDLRSPLANIVSSLDMLKVLTPTDNNPALNSVLSIATRSTERLQRLISSLLDTHRLEAGQSIVNQQPVDLPALAHEAFEAVTPVVESKRQNVAIDFPPAFPVVLADNDMIRRVIINLLDNAVKFTPTGGKIAIGGEYNEEWAQLWVQDSGPGIPAEALEQVFNKYTRLQADQFPKGVGLGLAFCRLVIQAHGGKIWVESQEGSGSRFVFTLPVRSAS
ncbi:MAG: GAF domain-containing protein [Chloroflexi bacterium]|nr:ATP-binding protein [Anaerolineaceae bacterium]NMB90491.1 GAF domain-containing protein [Chloroflexota bacterium]